MKGASNSQGATMSGGASIGSIPGHVDSYDMDGLRNPALTVAL